VLAFGGTAPIYTVRAEGGKGSTLAEEAQQHREDRGADRDPSTYDPDIAVSVLVINWNGRPHLEVCLRSLLRQTLAGVEVVLVDNASTDDSLQVARRHFGASVRIVALPENRGYAGGLNAAITAARGRYLFALNNDTEVDTGCLAALVEAADRHPSAGMLSPKILSFDDRSMIDNVGHLLYADGLSRGRGRLETDHGQYEREEDIVLPSGCAMLLRRAMLADIGMFDEDLFAYCEDTDLGLRARLAGWRCVYVPAAVVYHKYSAASAAYSPLKAFLVERNRAWVAVKCLPGPLLLASPIFTLLRLAAQAWGALSGRGAAGRFASLHSAAALAAVLLRSLAAAARGLPHMWRKRRRIQARRRIGTGEAIGWMRRYGMGLREIAFKD
jgi:GT2 family glycosyltransferase